MNIYELLHKGVKDNSVQQTSRDNRTDWYENHIIEDYDLDLEFV